MLETFLHAKKFLKPGGKMFPSRGDLHLAPFTDEALYMEQFNKVNSKEYCNYFKCDILGEFLVSRIFPRRELVLLEKCSFDRILPPADCGHVRREHLHRQDPASRDRLPGQELPGDEGNKTNCIISTFQAAHETDLHRIEIPLEFHMLQTGTVHGIAFWFDVAFIGTNNTVWLSTAPTQPLTHWYQVGFHSKYVFSNSIS